MASTIDSQGIDSQSRAHEIIAIVSFMAILSSSIVALRLFTRLKILKACGLDDWVMVAAQVFTLGTAVAIGMESRYGLGRHVWTISKEETIPYLKTFYASILLYNFALAVVKVSILLQYRRIFTAPAMQKACVVGLVVIICWAITQIFLNAMICMPAASFWDPTVPGKCIPFLPLWYTYAVVNIITDFSIFILPLPALKSLQLPKRQKIILFVIFGLGLFTCAISLVRIRFLKVAAKSTDPTWDNVDAATWSLLELSLAIISASLPTLRTLLVKIVPQLSSLSSRKLYTNTYVRQGISQGTDVEAGTSSVRYGSCHDSTASIAVLRQDADYPLQHLEKNNQPTSHDAFITYISASTTMSKGTNLEDNTEKGNRILATTIVTQEFVDKK
ncbi:hypothetical protein BKA65DRAFT_403405 [Rhexocercosporidium sp. MPI-PUGE-AT-0058]|nr:hypothetical protein BKA65DRAFT_403405 [Rhexocercosporidium sp. MPI-PUGE-AT-0058]